MKQELKLTLEQDQITGFSYSFCTALLKKLKKLIEENRVFVDGNDACTDRNYNHNKTKIAGIVVSYLHEYVDSERCQYGSLPEILELVAHTEEFLACFTEEVKE